MARTVSLRDANQHFARLMREVTDTGEEVIITRRGTPVARLVPVRPAKRELTAEQKAALDFIFSLSALAKPDPDWKFNRDELYDL